MRFSRQALAGVLFASPAILFLIVFVAYPVLDAVWLSLLIVDFATDQTRFVGLANFAQMLRDPKLVPVATNTLVWTVASLIGQFGLGLGSALCISRDVPGMHLIRTILLLPYVVPVIAIALFWRCSGAGYSTALPGSSAICSRQPRCCPPTSRPSAFRTQPWRASSSPTFGAAFRSS